MDFSYEKTICLILQEETWPRMIWSHMLKFNSVFLFLYLKCSYIVVLSSICFLKWC